MKIAVFMWCFLCSPVWGLSFDPGTVLGTVQSDQLTEISGLVASRRHPGVLWVHNDSGDQPNIYAINTQGALLATYRVTGAEARDWEDIAMGPGPQPGVDYVYIGDIGDNAARRGSVTIYRVPEPRFDPAETSISGQTLPAESLVFTYPDGPRDAETVLVDPHTGDLYLISKREWRSRLYRASSPQIVDRSRELEFVTNLPVAFVVGGDISADGAWIVLRNLTQAWLWPHDQTTPLRESFSGPPQSIPLLPEPQGEAICFSSSEWNIYTLSEMSHPPLHFYRKNTPN